MCLFTGIFKPPFVCTFKTKSFQSHLKDDERKWLQNENNNIYKLCMQV